MKKPPAKLVVNGFGLAVILIGLPRIFLKKRLVSLLLFMSELVFVLNDISQQVNGDERNHAVYPEVLKNGCGDTPRCSCGERSP
jgi:hypothetical protein